MISIHHREGSFSTEWIKYCENNSIPYKVVDGFDNDIVNTICDSEAFLWHYHHAKRADMAAAPRLLRSLEHRGLSVFPNHHTSWYFDDKVAQKYLFESHCIPTVKTKVFYDVKKAYEWLNNTAYPVVFKSSSGAGSSGVLLFNNKRTAKKAARRSIQRGISPLDKKSLFKDLINRTMLRNIGLSNYLKKLALFILPNRLLNNPSPQAGVALFQEFVPGNDSDVRVIVIAKRAFAIRRFVRENDFRASGSGAICFEMSSIGSETIKLAFKTAEAISSDCCAIDFIYNSNGEPLVVEVSYGFTIDAYRKCPGYWTSELKIVRGEFNPYGWMIESVLEDAKFKRKIVVS